MAKILIASEDFGALECVAAVVEGIGHEVVRTPLSMEIVEDAVDGEVDLVVVDELMTPYTGLEICVQLRQDPRVPSDLPIFLMISRDISTRALEAKGVTEVFSKGFSSIELESMILDHLGDKAGPGTVAS